MKQKLKALWKAITGQTIYSSYGYSQTLVTSGVYKLHEQGFRGQGIRVYYFGCGLAKSPFLSEMEKRIKRLNYVPGETEYEGQLGEDAYHENYVANTILTYIPKLGASPFLESYTNVKVKSKGGGWTPDTVAQALTDIINLPESQRPHIIGFSFGVSPKLGIDLTEYSFKNVETKIKQLQSIGVVFFGSAGNSDISIPDWPSSVMESVGGINFNGGKYILASKGKWCFYASHLENYNELGVKTFIEGGSFATPSFIGSIASYLSMKVAKGSNLKQILSSLETSLRLDNYLKETPNGLLFQVP